MPSGWHGIDGVGNEIREHLNYLTMGDRNFSQVVEAGLDRNGFGAQLGAIDREDFLDQVVEINMRRRADLAIEAQSLPRDMRDAQQLLFGSQQMAKRGFGLKARIPRKKDKVHDRLKRIVDLMSDCGRHAAGCSKLLRLNQGLFHALSIRDIPRDLGSPDHDAFSISEG